MRSLASLNLPTKQPSLPSRLHPLPSKGAALPSLKTGLKTANPQPLAVRFPRPARPEPLPMAERMRLAKERLRSAAEAGQRLRSYEVALDLDLSEFHFARMFRAAFDCSPRSYYNQVRATRARALLAGGMDESEVAQLLGFRRPGELRSLLLKRSAKNSE